MAIAEMKKIFLFAHQAEKDKIMHALHSLGMVEIRDIQENPSWEEWEQYLAAGGEQESVSRLETKIGEVKYALDFLARHFPVKKSFVDQFTGGKLKLTPGEFATYCAEQERVQAIYQTCRQVDERLVALRNEETRVRNLMEALLPYGDFPLPLEELGETKRLSIKLGSLPAEEAEAFRNRLEETKAEVFFQTISQGREKAHLFLVHFQDCPEVEALLKQFSWTTFAGAKEFRGTPAQCIQELEGKLAQVEAQRQQATKELASLLSDRPRLMAFYDYLVQERDKLAAAGCLGRSNQAFFLTGWIRAEDIPQLEAELGKVSNTVTLVSREPEAGEPFPIFLENNTIVDPFEAVTKLYSMPNHQELDPTPLLMPFFFVFFGIALGDAGYGILLSLLSLFLYRKLKPVGMGGQLIKLLFFGGIATLGFGILSGSWFGDLLPIAPLWFNPLDDPMKMLLFSFALGVIHLYAGMGIQAYRSIKAGKVLDAIFDQGFWYLLLTGLMLLAVPGVQNIGSSMAGIGAVGLVLTQGRAQKNVVMKFLSGLLSLYNVTSYLSDVLSYSRLLALGLAGGVIAVAINTMGRLLGSGVIGIIVMVLLLAGGHTFNLIISTLGAFVHTSRLQYIEYFGKFFEGGGKAFTPFTIKNQYVQVEKREA